MNFEQNSSNLNLDIIKYMFYDSIQNDQVNKRVAVFELEYLYGKFDIKLCGIIISALGSYLHWVLIYRF
jgi:hypothetical protein